MAKLTVTATDPDDAGRLGEHITVHPDRGVATVAGIGDLDRDGLLRLMSYLAGAVVELDDR